MKKPCVFISCGQFTVDERVLGSLIADMVRKLTELDAFFAQDVQDLNGLDSNILTALHNCVGFIAVLHPRGEIERPDSSVITRASVWIEQEIAIAAYIQRVEKRPLPVIVFKHRSVCLEGLRSLLHLNPVEFSDESEVLDALPSRIAKWQTLTASGIGVNLISVPQPPEDNHPIRQYELTLVNETNTRITSYNGEVRVPARLLKHWSAKYAAEVNSPDPHKRCFRFDEQGRGAVTPHGQILLFAGKYCTKCAVDDVGGIGPLVSGSTIEAKVWVNDREYALEKSVKQLAIEAGR